jgi:hypothetical protein
VSKRGQELRQRNKPVLPGAAKSLERRLNNEITNLVNFQSEQSSKASFAGAAIDSGFV